MRRFRGEPHDLVTEPLGVREDAVEGRDGLHGVRQPGEHLVVDLRGRQERKEQGDVRRDSPGPRRDPAAVGGRRPAAPPRGTGTMTADVSADWSRSASDIVVTPPASRVTGPSLTSATCMSAPNRPVSTCAPRSRSTVTTCCTRGSATGPGAAAFQVGRRPLRVSPYSVNWLMTSSGAPVSAADRSPSRIRSSCTLAASRAALSSVSAWVTPTSTHRPGAQGGRRPGRRPARWLR